MTPKISLERTREGSCQGNGLPSEACKMAKTQWACKGVRDEDQKAQMEQVALTARKGQTQIFLAPKPLQTHSTTAVRETHGQWRRRLGLPS